jgi:DNA-binding transcriptional MerR regulator
MPEYRIGEAAKAVGMTVDTLRYYERRGLLPPVARGTGRVRIYDDKDISRLRFVRRAQKMNFSLDEIGQLLQMREGPQHVRDEVRELTQRKLREIEHDLGDLTVLRNELRLLVNLCCAAEKGCPILEKIDGRLRQ